MELRPARQVIAFRVLPRDTATAVFEYLPQGVQVVLVKNMGQDVAPALLVDVTGW